MSVARSVADVLRDHVVLELEGMDRMYLYTCHTCRPCGLWSDIFECTGTSALRPCAELGGGCRGRL